MAARKDDTVELDELQARRRVPWYARLIFRQRYHQALQLLKELGEDVDQKIKTLEMAFSDFPPQLKDERSTYALFRRLKLTPYEEVRQDLLVKIQNRLQDMKRSRLETARKIALEVIQYVNSAKVRYNIQLNDLPLELMDLDQSTSQAFRLLGQKSSEGVKEELLQKINRIIKPFRITKILPNLRTKLREFSSMKKPEKEITPSVTTYNGIKIFSKRELMSEFPSGFFLPDFFLPHERDLEKILEMCSELEFSQIEENLIPFGDDQIIRDILRQKKGELERNWQDQSKASSKGSVGHDRLNVKTRRPSDWQAKVKVVMGQGRVDISPIFSVPQEFLNFE